jgi:hypothetical protein
MPPDEPKLAQVIPLPVRRKPGVRNGEVRKAEARRAEVRQVQATAPSRKRGKGRVMVAGALLLGSLWMALEMAMDSIDDERGALTGEDSSDWTPFRPSAEPDERESDDAAGSAWFTTTGGGQGRR